MQTHTNGHKFPIGYASFNDYTKTLRINLAMCKRTPKLAHFAPGIEAALKAARKV